MTDAILIRKEFSPIHLCAGDTLEFTFHAEDAGVYTWAEIILHGPGSTPPQTIPQNGLYALPEPIYRPVGCPYCGGTAHRYNPFRMGEVCNGCGALWLDDD